MIIIASEYKLSQFLLKQNAVLQTVTEERKIGVVIDIKLHFDVNASEEFIEEVT